MRTIHHKNHTKGKAGFFFKRKGDSAFFLDIAFFRRMCAFGRWACFSGLLGKRKERMILIKRKRGPLIQTGSDGMAEQEPLMQLLHSQFWTYMGEAIGQSEQPHDIPLPLHQFG